MIARARRNRKLQRAAPKAAPGHSQLRTHEEQTCRTFTAQRRNECSRGPGSTTSRPRRGRYGRWSNTDRAARRAPSRRRLERDSDYAEPGAHRHNQHQLTKLAVGGLRLPRANGTAPRMISTLPNLLTAVGGLTFHTILADPPWQFANRTGKVAPEHRRLMRYETMPLDEIMALPVAEHRRRPRPPLSLGAERAARRRPRGDVGLGLHLQDHPDLAQGA